MAGRAQTLGALSKMNSQNSSLFKNYSFELKEDQLLKEHIPDYLQKVYL
jgi:hypothetical protein